MEVDPSMKKLRLTLKLDFGGGEWHEFSVDVPEAGGEKELGKHTASQIINSIYNRHSYNIALMAHFFTTSDA